VAETHFTKKGGKQMVVMDIRIEIDGVHDFKEIEELLKTKYKNRKIWEISLQNID